MPNPVQPSAPRSTVSEDLEGLRISIPAKWSWALLFPAAWLCAWTVGGITAGLSLFRHFNLFILFWMFGWAFGEIVVGYTVLYAIGGREIILVSADTVTCRRQIFRLGVTQSYRASEMRNLRFQPDASSGKTRIASRIAFDYGDKVFGFGTGLEESEASELINRIQQRCAIAATKPDSGIKFWRGN
jgi:hypothetical protein